MSREKSLFVAVIVLRLVAVWVALLPTPGDMPTDRALFMSRVIQGGFAALVLIFLWRIRRDWAREGRGKPFWIALATGLVALTALQIPLLRIIVLVAVAFSTMLEMSGWGVIGPRLLAVVLAAGSLLPAEVLLSLVGATLLRRLGDFADRSLVALMTLWLLAASLGTAGPVLLVQYAGLFY